MPPKIAEGWRANGRRKRKIRHAWGQVDVEMQRLVNAQAKHQQVFCDASLEGSGWTPYALERLMDMAGRLPFEEGCDVLAGFAINLSASNLEDLAEDYSQQCRQGVRESLSRQALEPLAKGNKDEARVMVLQIDGVNVLGKPQEGKCEGYEVKSMVLYPQESPSDRTMLADRLSAQELTPLLSGLLRQAAVSQQDQLVGLGDGAPWVDLL